MTLTKEDLEKAKKAWTNIKTQAGIDADQSEMYLGVIEERLKEYEGKN